MAADTRPYKSKEQDGQGNEVIIRDQQLVEQTSQTTMASGEYFEIVDVDGRMAKIPKANMVDIVREALGSLLNGLTDQTTVTKVPSLNGNTLGASTVATLASVLGDHQSIFTCKKYNMVPNASVTIGDADYLFLAWNIGGGHIAYAIVGNTVEEMYSTTTKPSIGVSAASRIVTLTNNHTGNISAYVWILRRPS